MNKKGLNTLVHMIAVVRTGVGVLFSHERKRDERAGAYDDARLRWRGRFCFSMNEKGLNVLPHMIV